jgi:hypothetical protein
MPGDANAPADCAHEKDLQMQAFSKRLKGFEPSTFCMASSRSAQENHGEMPANRRISASLMPDAASSNCVELSGV